ncbi:SAM-dependent chlorinase/fluorinase [Methylocaldum sp.]|uniref:SAM hydrolase/SAM-dependent halogenase family protein n=1 Tax=Methylocaldum sp. TaxID=1969727 RepID=UPI002D44E598|nr:SAM-dependent chlorinase/fluorinase [Methylocaldum sp.]HYE37141.1 SAM-dependent chlorinase/fluorinase [Methylocaldum sp.]
MILLFTDFGAEGPYLGQMEAMLRLQAPGVDIINLVSNAPTGQPLPSSYLLAALCRQFPAGSVFLGVVDPGVGGERLPVVLEADGRWFVGPDNGLFNTVAVQSTKTEWRIIDWRPKLLSSSFHGRDLFGPIAARIAAHDFDWASHSYQKPDLVEWPADLVEIIYFDHYGNAITGMRYTAACDGMILCANGQLLAQAETFCSVSTDQAFWYQNSMGLVEIAVNRGRADRELKLAIGTKISFTS